MIMIADWGDSLIKVFMFIMIFVNRRRAQKSFIEQRYTTYIQIGTQR